MTGARKRLVVLMVEDDPNDEELVLLELRSGGYDVTHLRVDTEPAMRAAFTRQSWDVVLSDFAMPQFSGPAALAVVKSLGLDLPFIIVSGTVGEHSAVAAMRGGAHDYVLKGALARLCPAIERELREAALRSEQRKMRDQLLISDRMASVGTLAAGVAHELNNPLAALMANLDLLGRDLGELSNANEPARLASIAEELRDARESADRMRHIVRDLKIFSRSPNDEQRGPVDVKRVLDSSLRMAWNEIRHRARLEKHYEVVPPVEANEARLGQVFLNLVVNAAQAIADGNAENNVIRVSTSIDASGRVAVEVRDSGSGIAPENLARVFDAFFTTKPLGVGTGLGLSICHKIITDLGGAIDLQSQVGKGTVIRVLLPASQGLAEVVEPVAMPSRAARRGTVLVVDDEPIVARAIVRTLEAEHEVVVSASGAEALERIAGGQRFDVILCDLMMPQMTGMEFYAELNRRVPQQATQVVFLSGGAFTPGARSFLDTVPNLRVEKPFSSQHLRTLINDRVK